MRSQRLFVSAKSRSSVPLEVNLDRGRGPRWHAGAEEVVVFGPDGAIHQQRGSEAGPVAFIPMADAGAGVCLNQCSSSLPTIWIALISVSNEVCQTSSGMPRRGASCARNCGLHQH